MADKILLAPQTGAGNSEVFYVDPARPRTCYLYPFANVTASEFCDLQREDPAGTWQDVYDSGFGGQVRLDSTVESVTIVGGGKYRWAKEATTNAQGVGLASNKDGG